MILFFSFGFFFIHSSGEFHPLENVQFQMCISKTVIKTANAIKIKWNGLTTLRIAIKTAMGLAYNERSMKSLEWQTMAKTIQRKFHTKFYSKLKYQTVVLLSSVKMKSESSGTGTNNQTEHYLFSHQSFLTRFMRICDVYQTRYILFQDWCNYLSSARAGNRYLIAPAIIMYSKGNRIHLVMHKLV